MLVVHQQGKHNGFPITSKSSKGNHHEKPQFGSPEVSPKKDSTEAPTSIGRGGCQAIEIYVQNDDKNDNIDSEIVGVAHLVNTDKTSDVKLEDITDKNNLNAVLVDLACVCSAKTGSTPA